MYAHITKYFTGNGQFNSTLREVDIPSHANLHFRVCHRLSIVLLSDRPESHPRARETPPERPKPCLEKPPTAYPTDRAPSPRSRPPEKLRPVGSLPTSERTPQPETKPPPHRNEDCPTPRRTPCPASNIHTTNVKSSHSNLQHPACCSIAYGAE